MGSSRHSTAAERSNGIVVLTGSFKKYKNGRKKFFVLRDEDEFTTPRLEYYDSEKKFNAGQMPKRSIALRTCFDIGKRADAKYRNVIALYTKDDCFCFIVDNDETFNTWMRKLIALQRGEGDGDDSDSPKLDGKLKKKENSLIALKKNYQRLRFILSTCFYRLIAFFMTPISFFFFIKAPIERNCKFTSLTKQQWQIHNRIVMTVMM